MRGPPRCRRLQRTSRLVPTNQTTATTGRPHMLLQAKLAKEAQGMRKLSSFFTPRAAK